jgi:tryptophanyl-tRNA synthetase
MGLDDPTVKMSKSDHPDSFVALSEPAESVIKKFKRAVTDSDTQIRYDKTTKPSVSNLIEIYCSFADKTPSEVERQYEGKGYGEFKQDLGELVADKLSVLQKEFHKYKDDEAELLRILAAGNLKASEIANKKVTEVKLKIGLL